MFCAGIIWREATVGSEAAQSVLYCYSTMAKALQKRDALFDKLKSCIDEKIRPLIQMDGGEIELVELTEDHILKVRLHGACQGCFASSMTLQYGVQQVIDQEFPDEAIMLELIPNE